MAAAGSEVKCSFGSCPRIFQSFYRLKNDMTREHFNELCESDVMQIDDHDDDGDANFSYKTADMSMEPEEFGNENLENSVMRFLSMLQSKPNITLSNVQVVAENLVSIFEEFSNYAVNVVRQMCMQLAVPLDSPAVLEAYQKFQHVKNVTLHLDTAYKREKWLEKSGFFLRPCEITLGTREVQRYSSSKRTNCSVIEEDTYQLVFLDKLLAKVLENAAFLVLF